MCSQTVISASRPNMVCTTPWNDTEEALERAQRIAEWFECPCVERRGRSVANLFADLAVHVVVVADERPILYHVDAIDQPLFFHPGMAQQRLDSLRHGELDRLLRVAQITEGDLVVDATLGLGADSLVLAYGVGPTGKVLAIESSWCLAKLFTYAQTHPHQKYAHLEALLNRIEVVHGHHYEVLHAMPDNSVDVVYFDPMFRHPPKRPSNLDAGRVWTNTDALTEAAWEEAKRVTRRAVVLKERPLSQQFERFHLLPDKTRSRFAYGVWRKGGTLGV